MHSNKRLALFALAVVAFGSFNALALYSSVNTPEDRGFFLAQVLEKRNSGKPKASDNKPSSPSPAPFATPSSSTLNNKSSTSDPSKAEEGAKGNSEEGFGEKSKEATSIPPKSQDKILEKIGKRLADRMKEKPESELNVLAEFTLPPGRAQVDEVEKALKGSIKHSYKNIPAMALTLPAEAVEQLAQREDVKRIDLDFQVKTVLNTSREAIQADSSQENYGYVGEGIKVAVIDTGVDKAHPALTHAIVEAVDFTGEGPQDMNGHGTHVACIIACDDATYSGVAPGAQIYSAKALNQNGVGMASDILAALDWAMKQEVDVINLSLGGYIEECGLDVFSQILNQVEEAGFLPVVAAGNAGPDSETILSPGCAEKALTVGASLEDQSVASFSSRGPTAEGITKPDVVAPGVNITAAFPGGRFATLSGTSMATPHVSGLAALLLEARPDLSPSEIKTLLQSHAKDLLADPTSQGAGLAQSLTILEALLAEEETAPEDPAQDPAPEEPLPEETEDEAPEEEPGDEEAPEETPEDFLANLFGKCVSQAVREKSLDPRQKQVALNSCREQFHRSSQEEQRNPEEEMNPEIEAPEDSIGEDDRPSERSPGVHPSSAKQLDFIDAPEAEWFYPYLYSLKRQNCIQGYNDGEFKPDREVSLGEGLRLVTKCLLEEKLSEKESGHWAEPDLNFLKEEYKGQLEKGIAEALKHAAERPTVQLNKPMSRAAAVELLVSVLEADVPTATEVPFSDVPLSHPHVDAIAYAKHSGLISGDEGADVFRPKDFIKRAEMSKLVFVAKQLR